MRQTTTPYQYKLDLGEGPECQDAYQEYLSYHHFEDSNERWAMFVKTWNLFYEQARTAQAMREKDGATLQ